MKKVLFIMLTLAATMAWAVNDITIVPAADVHVGGAAGAAEGFIDGTGKLDVSGMTDGSLVVFDVIMTDLDFTLAGYEFKFDFPVNLVALSLDDAEWEAGAASSAIYMGAGFTSSTSVQWLPADSDGTRNASTVVNFDGTYRVGMLWTDAANRPVGTGGATLTDKIGRISFVLDGAVNCTSLQETIEITITASDPQFVPDADIFANDAAARVIVGSTNASVSFGEPGAFIRADGDANGVRNALDLLPAAYCSIAGQDDATCNSAHNWSDEPEAAFIQAFDYDCNGAVNAIDLLGNALMTVGQSNRSASKNATFVDMTAKNGSVTMGFDHVTGGMGFAALSYTNMKLEVPTISEAAKKLGWTLIYVQEADTLNLAVFNVKSLSTTVPKITMSYKTNGQGGLALLDSFIQDKNMETHYVDLQMEDSISVSKPLRAVPVDSIK